MKLGGAAALVSQNILHQVTEASVKKHMPACVTQGQKVFSPLSDKVSAWLQKKLRMEKTKTCKGGKPEKTYFSNLGQRQSCFLPSCMFTL